MIVITTGVQHSVREFAILAFYFAGTELEWKGEGMDEVGIDQVTGRILVEVSPDFIAQRMWLICGGGGDPTKAKQELGWNPTQTSFEKLVKIMVDYDMQKVMVK